MISIFYVQNSNKFFNKTVVSLSRFVRKLDCVVKLSGIMIEIVDIDRIKNILLIV